MSPQQQSKKAKFARKERRKRIAKMIFKAHLGLPGFVGAVHDFKITTSNPVDRKGAFFLGSGALYIG